MVSIKQSSKYISQDWWSWQAWIESTDEELDKVDHVVWMLHPTFANPIRKSTDRANKFRIETEGWGIFEIKAKVVFSDGREKKLTKELELYYPDGKKNLA